MRKRKDHQASENEKPNLIGTFISVMLLGAFIIITWFGAYALFISR
ncbi:cytochrome c oxidase subunit 2A [Ornithinibacillus scapharcae]|nr:cytochrome c oxidase subunit 2A [Ornithinibacillus scapharcae]